MLRLGRPEEIDAIVAIDDDASTLYFEAALSMANLEGHPFALKERASWLASSRAGRLFVFCDPDPMAFAALGIVDPPHIAVRSRATDEASESVLSLKQHQVHL